MWLAFEALSQRHAQGEIVEHVHWRKKKQTEEEEEKRQSFTFLTLAENKRVRTDQTARSIVLDLGVELGDVEESHLRQLARLPANVECLLSAESHRGCRCQRKKEAKKRGRKKEEKKRGRGRERKGTELKAEAQFDLIIPTWTTDSGAVGACNGVDIKRDKRLDLDWKRERESEREQQHQ